MLNFQISDIFVLLHQISAVKINAVFRLDLRIPLFINCIAISNFGSHRGMYHVGPHYGASQCDIKHHQHEVLQQIAMVLRGQQVRLFRQKSITSKSQPPTNIQKLLRRIFFPKEHYAQSLSNSIRASMRGQ